MTQDLQREQSWTVEDHHEDGFALLVSINGGKRSELRINNIFSSEMALDIARHIRRITAQATTDGRREGADALAEKAKSLIASPTKELVDRALAEYKKELEK